ncbi:MAG: TIGR03086 family metal-binding protein [Actinocatenispora sp.]
MSDDVDRRELDRLALASTDRVVGELTDAHLDLPTPCGAWRVRDLLVHMMGEHRGFAAAARGEAPDPAVWAGAPLGDDPRAQYRRAAAEVTAAFDADGMLDRTPVLHPYGPLPARTVLGMHFVDYLVHGWDLARSLGVPSDLDEALSTEALAIALRWPPERPSPAFGVVVETDPAAPTGDRLVAYLGRDPRWQPSDR